MKNTRHKYGSSLFLKFALIVVMVASVSLLISLAIYRENITQLLTAEVEGKATIFLFGLEPSIRRFLSGRETIGLTALVDERAASLTDYLTFKIIRLAVLDPRGTILDHTVPERIGQIHQNDDFRQALAGGRPLVIREVKVFRHEPGSPEVPVIKIYFPIYQRNGEVMAMIMMDVDAGQTIQIIRTEYGRYNRRVIMGFALTTVLMVIGILVLLKRRIINPVADLAHASAEIAHGNMNLLPLPKAQDEMAGLIRAFNQMVAGLRQRDAMRLSLELAREVQQKLLPKNDPKIDGLDIAGKSVYCDSTGGDYYDYLTADGSTGAGRILVVVGDVSDHGIQSALLMATARSALHQCWLQADNLGQILSAMNRQLVMDVEESGYFMTMLLARIDQRNGMVSWANAGHDPALVYQRNTDIFSALEGRGLALGVDPAASYAQWQRGIAPGQILIMGTDGIWEARRENGELFGKERLKGVVRRYADASAREIVGAIIDNVKAFVAGPLEDDITVTVIKVVDEGPLPGAEKQRRCCRPPERCPP